MGPRSFEPAELGIPIAKLSGVRIATCRNRHATSHLYGRNAQAETTFNKGRSFRETAGTTGQVFAPPAINPVRVPV